MPKNVETWRPVHNTPYRLFESMHNVYVSPIKPNPWIMDALSFSLTSGALADINLGTLNYNKREVIFDFFRESMYFNRYIDPYIYRIKHGRRSLLELENFWNLPKRIKNLNQQGEEAGFDKFVVSTIQEWFTLNNILNLASNFISKQGTIDWGTIRKDCEEDPLAQKIAETLEVAFTKIEDKDKVKEAILFRVISSLGLARTLGSLACDKKISQNESGIWKRLGAMVMVAQTIDDFCTPVKDVKYQIAGSIATTLENPQLTPKGKLLLNSEQAKKAIGLAQGIIYASLDTMDIDPVRSKRKILEFGVAGLFFGSSPIMMKKYGRTKYPPGTITEMSKAILSDDPINEESQSYREFTRKAFNIGVSAFNF